MAKKSSIIDKDMGLKRIIVEASKFKNVDATVGVHEGKRNSEGLNIAEYGAHNEFGTSKIPERSFMRSTFDENAAKYQNLFARRIGKIGTGATLDGVLNFVGMNVQNDIQAKIRSGIAPANAPSTIKAKGSEKTLIDSGALIQSITYEITKK